MSISANLKGSVALKRVAKDKNLHHLALTDQLKLPLVVINSQTPPDPYAAVGDIVYNPVTKTLFYYDDNEWREVVGSSGSGIGSILIPDPPRRLHICDSTDSTVNWEPAGAFPELGRNEIFMHGPDETQLNNYLVLQMNDVGGALIGTSNSSSSGGFYNGIISIPTSAGTDLTISSGGQLNLQSGIDSLLAIQGGNGTPFGTADGSNVQIVGGTGSSSGGATKGGDVVINGGISQGTAGTPALSGGHVQISGADGAGTFTAGSGGDVTITGGSSVVGAASSGVAGNVDIGGGTSRDFAGGEVTITGGVGTTVDGGRVKIEAGQGVTGGGPIEIDGGLASAGDGGAIEITGGQGTGADGGAVKIESGIGSINGGRLDIIGGNGPNGVGGEVKITPGNGATKGNLIMTGQSSTTPAGGSVQIVGSDDTTNQAAEIHITPAHGGDGSIQMYTGGLGSPVVEVVGENVIVNNTGSAGNGNIEMNNTSGSGGFVDFNTTSNGVRYTLANNTISNTSNTAGTYAPSAGSGSRNPKTNLSVTTNGLAGKFTINYGSGAGIGFWEEQRVVVTNSRVTSSSVILLTAESRKDTGTQGIVGVNVVYGTVASNTFDINISSLDTTNVGGTNSDYIEDVTVHYLIINPTA